MKKLIMLLGVSSLLLAACGEESTNESTEENQDETEEIVEEVEADEEEDSEETEEPEEIEESEEVEVGTRSNPVPLGEAVLIEDSTYDDSDNRLDVVYELKITDVIRGEEAYDILLEENQFNEPAPEGYEWVIANLEVELIEGDDDYPFTIVSWDKIIASTGSEVSQDDYGTLAGNEFGYSDLFPGGTHSGRTTFYVPEEDESLYAWEVMFDKTYYFSLTE